MANTDKLAGKVYSDARGKGLNHKAAIAHTQAMLGMFGKDKAGRAIIQPRGLSGRFR